MGRDSTPEQIRSSFKRLAMEFHPDRNPGNPAAEERFKEVAEAYDVLCDPDKRARYDRFGHANGGQSPFDGFAAGSMNDIFGEIFGEMFGGGRRRQRGRARGTDLRYHLEISFEEAAFGSVARIEIPRPRRCATCKGSGAKAGTAAEDLPDLPGHRRDPAHPGLLRHRPHLPPLQRRGADHRRALRDLRRRRRRHREGRGRGEGSARSRHRHAPQARAARASRPRPRPGRPGTSTWSCRCGSTPSSSARTPT